MKNKIAAIALLAVVGMSLTGCAGKDREWNQDSEVTNRDDTGAEAYNMPDGFGNFAEKCDQHGFRVFTLFHDDGSYGGIDAEPDPTCLVQ